MSAVISNASPLIGLSVIDQISILKELWGEILIPDAVYKGTVIDGKGKPGSATFLLQSNIIYSSCSLQAGFDCKDCGVPSKIIVGQISYVIRTRF